MFLAITPIYAGLLVVLLIALSLRVIRERVVTQISIGDRNNRDLRRKMRVHANFVEYVPMALLLMAFCELQGLPDMALHGLGGMLLIGRLSHAVGMGATPERLPLRVAGMVLTLGMLGLSAMASAYAALT